MNTLFKKNPNWKDNFNIHAFVFKVTILFMVFATVLYVCIAFI